MTGKKIHVLLITPGFPADENDTSCIPALQDWLLQMKLDYPYVIFHVLAIHYPFEKKKYKWNGFEVESMGGKNCSYPLRFFIWKKALSAGNFEIQSSSISIIHSFWMGESSWIAERLSKKNKIPHILTLMGQEASSQRSFWDYFLRDSVKIVTISQRMREKAINRFSKSDIRKIHFGIPLYPEKIPKDKKWDFLGAGNLIEVKNYSVYLEVFAELRKTRPQLRAALAGDGPERKKLELQAEKLNLGDSFQFLGMLPRPDLMEKMAQSAIFFHPSTTEGFGMVFGEALSRGMRILSGPVGIAEESDFWKLCETKDDYLEAARLFLQLPHFGQARNLYSISETAAKYCELYRELIDHARV